MAHYALACLYRAQDHTLNSLTAIAIDRPLLTSFIGD
jgi:hypothetical protein